MIIYNSRTFKYISRKNNIHHTNITIFDIFDAFVDKPATD